MEKMLIFVADLTTDPRRRFPRPGPPRCFAHPRPVWWPYGITPPLYNGISNTLVLNPDTGRGDEREKEKERKRAKERERQGKREESTTKGPKRRDDDADGL